MPVTTAPVVQKSVPLSVQGIGTVIAASTVVVRAQVTGELTSVNFIEGDEVQEGQVLVTIDKRPLEAALQQTQAALDRDVAQAANARSQAARYQDLLKRGIATKEQVDQIVANAAALDATVELDRANIDNQKVQLQYATTRAPLTGKTGLPAGASGNLAGHAHARSHIDNYPHVYVSVSVPEATLHDLKRYVPRGKPTVTALAPNEQGPPATGLINFIDNAVDPTTGQIKVKGTFPNTDRRLWPGQYVNVNVTLSTEPNAIVAPSLAVQTGQQGTYVSCQAGPDRRAADVVIERTSGEQSVIQSG